MYNVYGSGFSRPIQLFFPIVWIPQGWEGPGPNCGAGTLGVRMKMGSSSSARATDDAGNTGAGTLGPLFGCNPGKDHR